MSLKCFIKLECTQRKKEQFQNEQLQQEWDKCRAKFKYYTINELAQHPS
jgi:hypothetical protein